MKRSVLLLAVAVLAACTQNPSPTAAPSGLPNGITPVASVAKTIAEPRIRVGMLSDQTSVTFPRIDRGYYLITDSGASTLRRGFTDTAPVNDTTLHYAVQASAVSDKPSSEALADKLHTQTGQRVDAIFDPAAGLYRILVGDFADALSAQPLRDQLVAAGYGKDMLIVRRPTGQPFPHQHQIVDDEGQRTMLTGDSVLVLPITADTVTIDQKPYRTAARVFISNRGLFNVINELNLEDYLRGVVPAEMGSKVYDELEGLKAQAVAARTYAMRNFGQFRTEGYDICPGPACQAYKGFSGEEALTDQAVLATAGLIMTYEGKPIDALFTSTCGGETSDVGTMFPGRNEPYLKHVRCVEFDMTTLAGRRDSDILNELQLNAQLFGAASHIISPAGPLTRDDLAIAISATRQLVGLSSAPALPPPTSRRGDVLRYLGTVFRFAEYGDVVTLPEDRKYYFPQTAIDRAPTAYAAAAFLIKFGFLPTESIDGIELDGAISTDEVFGILGSWLRKHGALNEVSGKITSIDGRELTLKSDGKTASFVLPEALPIFRKLGDRYQEYKVVPIMIGDRAFLQLDLRKIPIALVVQGSTDGASFDRTSSFADWTRSFRADEMVASINRRNPIKQLLGLRPLAVDAAHRIAELEVTAEGGRTFVLRGLPIRWSLNVPDNLFVFEKSIDPDGVDRYTFYGKGWGHGVGMCQVGAYGMAFRGFTFDKILKRYYTGIDIVTMNQASGLRR